MWVYPAHLGQVPDAAILAPPIDLVAAPIEHSNAVGASFFPCVEHRLSSGFSSISERWRRDVIVQVFPLHRHQCEEPQL